jgi:hypothetical protein
MNNIGRQQTHSSEIEMPEDTQLSEPSRQAAAVEGLWS